MSLESQSDVPSTFHICPPLRSLSGQTPVALAGGRQAMLFPGAHDEAPPPAVSLSERLGLPIREEASTLPKLISIREMLASWVQVTHLPGARRPPHNGAQ